MLGQRPLRVSQPDEGTWLKDIALLPPKSLSIYVRSVVFVWPPNFHHEITAGSA